MTAARCVECGACGVLLFSLRGIEKCRPCIEAENREVARALHAMVDEAAAAMQEMHRAQHRVRTRMRYAKALGLAR